MKFLSRTAMYLLVSIASGLAFGVRAQDVPNDCTDLQIDSAGVLAFHRTKIAGVARSHGLNGLADYVRIVPPQQNSQRELNEIEQMIVMPNARQLSKPECIKLEDPKEGLVSCAQSIGGYPLKLIVKFRGENHETYRAGMPSLMSYMTRDVLCSQSSKDAIRL